MDNKNGGTPLAGMVFKDDSVTDQQVEIVVNSAVIDLTSDDGSDFLSGSESESDKQDNNEAGAVDVYAGLDRGCVVTWPFDVKLVKINPAKNEDKFLIMQCIEKSDGAYCIYMRWGAAGTIGNDSMQDFATLHGARAYFVKHFFKKTGVAWSDRASAVDGKYRCVVQNQARLQSNFEGAVWEYRGDGKATRWHAYDDDACRTAEQMYTEHSQNQNLAERYLKLGGTWVYALDFQNMTQTNLRHENKTCREIRRRIVGVATKGGQSPKPKESTNSKITNTKEHKRPSPIVTDDSSATSVASKKIKVARAAASKNELADGEEMQVPGRGHKIKNVGVHTGAWRFQSQKNDVRTCKHKREFRGEDAEKSRMEQNGGGWLERVTKSTATSPPKKNKAPKVAAASRSGVLFDASNLTLAHKWDPSKNKTHSNYLMSEKLDGMRALWNGVELVSRAGNHIDAPDFFLQGFPSDMALDGELFMGRGQFQETISITRRQNGGELWRQIRYVVFDAPTVAGGFEARIKEAEKIAAKLEFADILEHTPCRDEDHLNGELERIEKLGGEGLMMREKGSSYATGRSQKLLKVKTFVDGEGVVYGHQQGTGKHSGRMGALLCRLRNGTEFKVGSGFSDQERENPPAIGSIVTVKYFELTKAGVPRFPTFQRARQDVDASEFAT